MDLPGWRIWARSQRFVKIAYLKRKPVSSYWIRTQLTAHSRDCKLRVLLQIILARMIRFLGILLFLLEQADNMRKRFCFQRAIRQFSGEVLKHPLGGRRSSEI